MSRPERLEDDWSELAKVWHRSDAEPPLAPSSIRRRAALGRLRFFVEAAGALGSGAYGLYVAVSEGLPEIGVASVAFTGFLLAVTLWSRTRPVSATLGTAREAVERSLQQAIANHRWARGGQACCVAAFIFLGAVARYDDQQHRFETYVLVCTLLVLALFWYGRKARSARAHLRHLRKSLKELDR